MVLAVINSRSMPRDFLARIRNQPTLLLVVTPLLALNFWFDYYDDDDGRNETYLSSRSKRALLARKVFHREQLYSDFITESARVLVDALERNEVIPRI